eukprot:scaffold2619_cov129-Cylindrotheca_fusiformis.AAC.11
MVWNSIKNAVGFGEPTLPEGPTKLPDYFPVQPSGCEKPAENLFSCLANEATKKARDMERSGLHESYFADVKVHPTDEKAAAAVAEDPDNPDFPKKGDNPLDECRTFVAYYKRCCDRQLRKKKNLILLEHVRVQDEYRYNGNSEDQKKPIAAFHRGNVASYYPAPFNRKEYYVRTKVALVLQSYFMDSKPAPLAVLVSIVCSLWVVDRGLTDIETS